MKKLLFIVLVILIFLLIGIFPSALRIRYAKGQETAVIIVPDDYATIQIAINEAHEDMVIFVKAGIYGGDITINKAGLKIFGDGRQSVIQGSVFVEADNILLSGFTIGGGSDTGIFLKNVDSCTISNNNVSNKDVAISIYNEPCMLEQTYGRNSICGNILSNNNIGILSILKMGIPPDIIYGNYIFGNTLVNNNYGILISYDIGIPDPNKVYGGNIIRGNTLLNNSHSFYFNYSLGTLSLSDGESITFGENIIQGNNVTNNGYVIEVYCEEIGILNTYGDISLIFGCNKIFNNYFVDNNILRNACIKYIDIWNLDTLDGKSIITALECWDDGYPSGGNYWSDYTGVDERSGPNQDLPGSDGVGDIPYVIDALNSDKYPLMTSHVDLDSTPPSTITTYNGLWQSTNFTIYLLAIDELSGVKETYYRINNGPVQNLSVHGHPFITTESDNNTLEYWSVDNAGNEEPHRFLTGIKLDKTDPSIAILKRLPEGDVEPDQEVKVLVNVTDLLSGVKDAILSYNINNSLTWINITMTFNMTSGLYEGIIQGQHAGTIVKYKIIAYDNAENYIVEDNNGQYYDYTVVPEFSSSLLTLLMLMILSSIFAIITKKNWNSGKDEVG
ncbi:MAG: hypothetical protein B6U95_07475 [Thermofilum sp. ex4484_82]|nr:MAG: hypothetical protein B6U95_07475 [Thermofilum sp. ex4484_82]OYT37113.1 MAG: hypothetical protein B6U96_07470 [Archaeoglobales archaeon ex4484_92]